MKKFWDYNNYFSPPISAQFQLTLGEGLPAGASAQAGSTPVYTPVVNWSTPLEVCTKFSINEGSSRKAASPQGCPKALNTTELLTGSMAGINGQPVDNFSGAILHAKKEFLNPTGTHKDRSFAYWISYWHAKGAKELAIASSGNSAISAAAYCAKAGIRLHAFVSPRLAFEKKEKLAAYGNVVVHEESLPRKAAIQFSLARNIPNLLASKHDEGTEGYKTIAFEIAEQMPDVTHIFVPTSSGATLQGMYRGFEMLKKEKGTAIPHLYAVQTTKVHPIAEKFDKAFAPETQSRAQAIVDRVCPRRSEIIAILQKTNGGGYVISQKELEEAREMLQDENLGWQSVLAFAGFIKFEKQKAQQDAGLDKMHVMCLFTD